MTKLALKASEQANEISQLKMRNAFDENSMAEQAAEITRLRAEVAARWLPIESAPKDGTEILGGELYRYLPYKPDGRRQMRADGRWQRWNGTRYENCEAPSHFQPLFAPPQPESAT